LEFLPLNSISSVPPKQLRFPYAWGRRE